MLFTENPDAVVFCDETFRILDVNPNFTNLFGFSSDEARGRDIHALIVPLKLQEESLLIRRNLLEGRVERNTTRLRKDGSEVYVSLSAAPLIMGSVITGFLLVYKDITDLVFANRELNNMLEEINRILSSKNLLNEKLSVTGSLTRHDVRNKLGAITNYIYLAKKRLQGQEEVRSYLMQMDDVVKSIVRILDFAKTFEMLGNQPHTTIDVSKMISDGVSLFADLKGVKVINECQGFQVQADSLLMEIFHNLIDDSLKYGDKISEIRIFTRKCPDGSTEMIYEDDGVGIDPEMKARLFQKGAGKGTGYGLWLIKRICEMYGWTITEKGLPGKGVRFEIRIPRASAASPQAV